MNRLGYSLISQFCSPCSCSLVTRTFDGGPLNPSSRKDPVEKISSGGSSNSGHPSSMFLQEGERESYTGGGGCPLKLLAPLHSLRYSFPLLTRGSPWQENTLQALSFGFRKIAPLGITFFSSLIVVRRALLCQTSLAR